MPAPRCPPIHQPPSVWEEWARKYLVYNDPYRVYLSFDEFKRYRLVTHLGDLEIDRTWKYLLYLSLTGRKHRTLSCYM
jgi:hypothetical protein